MELSMNTLELSENKEAVKARTQARNYSIEFLRFFFTIGVIVGHCWCIFYQLNEPSYIIWFHNACVDFFFVLSGYFMARHFEAKKTDDKYRTFVNYNLSRIKRLWPLLFVAILESIIFDLACNLLLNRRFYFSTNFWGAFLFLGGLNNFAAGNIIWYISALFWCGLLLSALLCFRKQISVCCCFPLLAFLCLSFMNVWGTTNLGSIPLVGNWFSVGLIRGTCGLIFGIEGYYLSILIKEKLSLFSEKSILISSVLIEIGFISLVFYLIIKQHLSNKEFLMYFFAAALLIVFELNTQKIFKLFNRKIFGYLGKMSAWLYVLHFYILKSMYYIPKMRLLPHIVVYAVGIIFSLFFAIFVNFILTKIAKFIKRFCFINY